MSQAVRPENDCKFQSTRPARGATVLETSAIHRYLFQSTRPARGATTFLDVHRRTVLISIHAPREGRDKMQENF